jgi:hypothetical protein
MERPTFPEYAVRSLTEMNNPLPEASKEWKSMGRLTVTEAKALQDKIRDFLHLYTSLRSRTSHVAGGEERKRIVTHFIGDAESDFLGSSVFQDLLKSVQETGVLFLDTEFTDARTLQSYGCKQAVSSGTIDLIQLGSLSGHAALLQVNYDCREAHGCVCEKNCRMGKCDLNIMIHTAWQYKDSFRNYGVKVPNIVVDWLQDKSIIKVQSQIIRTDGSFGDIERLERLLDIKVCSFVELQNLTVAWYPQRDSICHQRGCGDRDFGSRRLLDQHVIECHGGNVQKKSGNSFLAEMLDIIPADKHYKKITGQEIWKVNRRKKWSQWSAALRYYDVSDVLVPAVFLLKVGTDIVCKERATCSSTNIIPYIRQILLLLKNEPSLVIKRKDGPPNKYFPFKDWSGFGCDNIRKSEARSFPWRPGMSHPNGTKVDGQIITRNLRQLAGELIVDPYTLGLSFDDLNKGYRPPARYADRLELARSAWIKRPVCSPPKVHNVCYEFQTHRFGYIKDRAESRKRRGEPIQSNPKRARVIPNHKVSKPVYYGHCFDCGDPSHSKEQCQAKLQCVYPLCSHKTRRHDIKVCDALHSLCNLCRLRGHNAKDHEDFDLVSLIKIATAWAPGGLFTSLPILSEDETFWRQPTNEEFCYDVFNQVKRFRYYEKNLR